jgi:ABC-type multidrug transport system ATPase subunit/pSer/pThr/pTyr-binding forkhead associated (FHA) protein
VDDRTEIVTSNPPRLELSVGGHTWQASVGRNWTIGRAHEADIRLENPRVSLQHAVLQATPAGWVLVNLGSNGMFVDGQRVESVTIISRPITVLLGSASSGEALQIRPLDPVAHPTLPAGPTRPEPPHSPQPSPSAPTQPLRPRGGTTIARAPTAVHAINQLVVTIGRAPENNVVLDDLLVSCRHATLCRSENRWELVDNNSANGTYVNGNRISSAVIGADDVVGIGHHLLHLSGDRLVEHVDTGDVSYEATSLRVVTNKGKLLLADVSFALTGSCFMAVLGPSGAGKSTLLGALTGFRPAGGGAVQYDGRDLYENYAELRHRIGFVPQDNILHTSLTVRRALNYAAQLRFPQEVSAEERNQRIEEVLSELGLAANADQRIDCLSGGQCKRTSVALELLTKPSLLFLDEPTSGLDPGYEKSVMQTLRGLADDGRSVVVVTHNTTHLYLCDRLLILAPGGRLAYFGPPQQALTYFGFTDFADLFNLLENDTTTDWTDLFDASPLYDALTGPRRAQQLSAPVAPTKPARQQSAFIQFVTLSRRYLAVIAADRQYSATFLLLPLLLSLFAHAAPGTAGLSIAKAIGLRTTQPSQLLVLLVIGGALMGCAASIREIVKERAIYQREHGIGLSRAAYLFSKLLVLTVITSLQGLILGLLGGVLLPPADQSLVIPWPRVEVAAAVVAVTVVSMIIGLLISATIGNADRGMPLLVVVVMAELVLCGGMFAVNGRVPLEYLAWLSPSRWAYAMGASTVDLNDLRRSFPGGEMDPMWDYQVSSWVDAAGACAVQALVLVILLAIQLKRLDPHRKAGK